MVKRLWEKSASWRIFGLAKWSGCFYGLDKSMKIISRKSLKQLDCSHIFIESVVQTLCRVFRGHKHAEKDINGSGEISFTCPHNV